MVVYNLYICWIGRRPAKTNAELVIHANSKLPRTVAFERFQSIARWYSQIVQPCRDFQLTKLASCDRFDFDKSFDAAAFSERIRVGAVKRNEHSAIVACRMIRVKP